MAEHTAQQWRDLHTAVAALIADPETPAGKKRRAEDVMGLIRRNPAAVAAINEKPQVDDLGWVDYL